MVSPPEEGVCEMCHKRPVEYADLICLTCKEAIDNDEPWTVEFEEILLKLVEWGDEDDRR